MNIKIIDTISEWHATDINSFYTFKLWLMLLFGFALTGRLRAFWVRIILFLGLLYMAFAHVRFVFTLVILTTIFLCPALSRNVFSQGKTVNHAKNIDRFFRSLIAPARKTAIIFSAIFIVIIAIVMNKGDKYAPDSAVTPEAAVNAAMAAGAQGPVLNDYAFGGFLIFRNIPVFIDSRADLYGDSFIKSYVTAVAAAKTDDLTTVLDEYHVAWTLLEPGSGAVAKLDQLPGWKRIYTDNVAVVHMREIP